MVKLFLENEPKQILMRLQNAFEQNLEPIRPNRSYTRDRKSKRMKGTLLIQSFLQQAILKWKCYW